MFWTNILPEYDYYSGLKTAIGVKQALLTSREGIANKVSGLQKEYQQKYSELERLGLVIPEKKDLAELISTIDSIFSATGTIPNGVVISSVKGGIDSQTDNITFDITTESTYESLLNLLAYLEKNIRLMDTTALTIGIKPGVSTVVGGSILLSIQIRGTAYYLKPLSEITPATIPTTSTGADKSTVK